MLDYAAHRIREALSDVRKAVMASYGPAGLQVSEFPCEALDLTLFLLIPQTSDHLFNLENSPNVVLLSDQWELWGEAFLVSGETKIFDLGLSDKTCAQCCVLVRVAPKKVQIRAGQGWGYLETFDLQGEEVVARPGSTRAV